MATMVGDDTIVQVSMHVNSSVSAVWQVLTGPDGVGVWLGPGAQLGGKGQSYRCDDGTYGVVRSYHPLEQLRLSWHCTGFPGGDDVTSAIEIDVTPEPGGTRLRLWHQGLPPGMTALMQQRWEQRLGTLASLVA